MSIHRIIALYRRYFYRIIALEQIQEFIFWPFYDIFIWGITMVWIQSMDGKVLALPVLTALVFWQIVWRSNYEISVNVLHELWNRNFVNLFATPMKLWEWVSTLMMVGVTKNAFTVAFGGTVIALLYSVNIFSLGWSFLLYALALIIGGWWCGLLSAGIIIYFGQRMQMLAWMSGYLLCPFSAVFYPLSSLPGWAQAIAKIIPMTYLFEGMRAQLVEGVGFSYRKFGMCLALNAIYLPLSLLFFNRMFEKSKRKGLARLE